MNTFSYNLGAADATEYPIALRTISRGVKFLGERLRLPGLNMPIDAREYLAGFVSGASWRNT